MILVFAITLAFLVIVALCVLDIWRALAAPQLVRPNAVAAQPFVSVLIPARDEAARIGACLAGLASQHYRSFEVIVVDDHSSDRTAAVAQNFGSQLPKLQILTGADLPPGWAGKCWACWQAAAQANSEWLLFLDADVVPEADLVGALVKQVQGQPIDAVTLMPRQLLGTLAERLLIPAFQTILYGVYPLHTVSTPSNLLGFFNGQAIFIKRAVYTATDGHRSVRESVLEDADYGALVKRAGYHMLAAEAFDLLQARMYTSWRNVSEGLGKNAVAGFRSGGGRSAWVGFRQSLIAYGGVYLLIAAAAVWASGSTVLGAVLLVHAIVLQLIVWGTTAWLFRRRYQLPVWWALVYPLGLALYFGVALRGFIRVRSGRGVVWKGRVLSGR